jgi:uncharacterized protein
MHMIQPLTIPKNGPTNRACDYSWLREEGLRYVQDLAHQLWTDHNVHDPGVTILEILCYAITDLGYRMAWPVEDLLTGHDGEESLRKQFLSALAVLPTRPVTVDDYRKILIDIQLKRAGEETTGQPGIVGIRNAWLREPSTPPFYVDCVDRRLRDKPPAKHPFRAVETSGIYDVLIEVDDDATDSEKSMLTKEAEKRLRSARNLCEDFSARIDVVERQELIICAEIEIAPKASVADVDAQVFHELQDYLTPPIRFRSLREMLASGMSTDEIFDGPILEHGFIDSVDLAASDLREEIRLSDMIQVIMGITGVRAIRQILVNPVDQPLDSHQKWTIPLERGKQPVLVHGKSRIVYYKDIVPFLPDESDVKKRIAALKRRDDAARLATTEDLPFPDGTFRDTGIYETIQNDFPRNYAIGPTGLAESATDERKARAKQLKAYLLFFDQILADYFTQLSRVRDLFSLDPAVSRTYFTQVVSGVRGMEELYKDFPAFSASIADPVGQEQNFEERRNRFLDNLLARFAEDFSEYVWMIHSVEKNPVHSSIEAKTTFLADYGRLSGRRSEAFDYSDQKNQWNTLNVTGLEERVSHLLGIRNYRRRNLAGIKYEIYQEEDTDGILEFRFRVVDERAGKIILSSSTKYKQEVDALREMRTAIGFALSREHYQLAATAGADAAKRYYFNVVDDEGEVLARRIEYFAAPEDREKAIRRVIEVLVEKYSDEGMFVVENILLRPRVATDVFLPVCQSPDCAECERGDPYSFRISVILPAFSDRFLDIDFRRFVEKTIRLETPAYVFPKICWVDRDQMAEFEGAYRDWLETRTTEAKAGQKAQNALVDVLGRLRNVYPEAHLTDCSMNSCENPFILGRTSLGTEKEQDNG